MIRTQSKTIERDIRSQASGLGMIESVYFRIGAAMAQTQLQKQSGIEGVERPYSVSDIGQPAVGVDLNPFDQIIYSSFSPPSSWNAPYSLQLARFGDRPKDDFLFYSGEALLMPVQGDLTGHFYWSSGGCRAERIVLGAVKPGTLCRINPQIPHHIWSAGEEASAWVILRHTSNSPAALVLEDELLAVSRAYMRRRISADELQQVGRYALIAWGIAELVRENRRKAGLTIAELAHQIGIDASSLSRLEEAKANISMEMLLRVCRVLRIGLTGRIASGGWISQRVPFPRSTRAAAEPLLESPSGDHMLHPFALKLSEGQQIATYTDYAEDVTALSSWIVLSGRALFEVSMPQASKSLVVDAGSVVHFRGRDACTIKSLSDCHIIQIACATNCKCYSAGSHR